MKNVCPVLALVVCVAMVGTLTAAQNMPKLSRRPGT